MQDLKDVTNNVHYENYRSRKLAAVTCNGVDTTKTKGQLTKYEAPYQYFGPIRSGDKRKAEALNCVLDLNVGP